MLCWYYGCAGVLLLFGCALLDVSPSIGIARRPSLFVQLPFAYVSSLPQTYHVNIAEAKTCIAAVSYAMLARCMNARSAASDA